MYDALQTAIPIGNYSEPLMEAQHLIETVQPSAPTVYIPFRNYARLVGFLKTGGYPEKLAIYFKDQVEKIAKYIYILDESGSTAVNNGKIFNPRKGTVRSCSRFDEMLNLAIEAYELFQGSNVSADFISLNNGWITHNSNPSNIRKIIPRASGGTPLCSVLRGILERVRRVEGYTKLVIVTDGQSNDGDIKSIIKEIQKYDVSITIRLCTDENAVVDYWNNIDKDLKLRLDIINVYPDEAEGVYNVNFDLNYTYYLHRIREFGVVDGRFDHVDEMKLSKKDIDFLNDLAGPRTSTNWYRKSSCTIM